MLSAVAVLAVIVVGVVVWRQSGTESADSAFAGGSDPGQGAPPVSGVEPGSPGSGSGVPGEPGEPGSAPPGSGAEVPPPGDEPPAQVAEGYIPLASFYRYDARHLALNYYNGIPECYGKAGEPRVEERADAVVVAIPRTPPTGSKDTACIEIAVAGVVDITLAEPLGDRVVLDAAQGDVEVEEAAAPHNPDQAR